MRSAVAVVMLVLCAFLVRPAAAQGTQCLEILTTWADEVRHQVNLADGSVVSYEAPQSTSSYTYGISPDGQFTTQVESVNGSLSNQLLLTDNRVGVSVVIARDVLTPRWSPDSQWLAYIQMEPDSSVLTLHLYHVESAEDHSVPLIEERVDRMARIEWSPDGTTLAVVVLAVIAPEAWDVHVFGTPELTRISTTRTSLISPTLVWAPSGQRLVGYGQNSEAYIIDALSGEAAVVPVTGYGIYQMRWSHDESYLLIAQSYNDWLDIFDVVTRQGEFVIEDVVVDTSYYSAAIVDWVDDYRLLASTVVVATATSQLTLLDAATGEQQILEEQLASFRVSPDRRYAAVRSQNDASALLLYDFSLEVPAVTTTLHTALPVQNFLWQQDGFGLLILLEDRVLRAYDFASETWQDIATIPGDQSLMRFVECSH